MNRRIVKQIVGKELKKSENDKASQPSVKVTGPSIVMNLEKQTLIFSFRKLLQLSDQNTEHKPNYRHFFVNDV